MDLNFEGLGNSPITTEIFDASVSVAGDRNINAGSVGTRSYPAFIVASMEQGNYAAIQAATLGVEGTGDLYAWWDSLDSGERESVIANIKTGLNEGESEESLGLHEVEVTSMVGDVIVDNDDGSTDFMVPQFWIDSQIAEDIEPDWRDWIALGAEERSRLIEEHMAQQGLNRGDVEFESIERITSDGNLHSPIGEFTGFLLDEEISDDVRWVSDEDGANWSIRNMGDASDLLTTSVPVIQPDPISAADVISGVMKLPDSTAPHNDWGSSLFNGMDDEFVESGGKEVFLIPGNENSINGLIQSELGLSNELDDSFYAISGIDDSSSVSTSQNRFVPSTLGVQFGLAEMSNLFLTSMVPSANDILGGSSNALSLDHRYKLHGDGDWLGEVGVDYAMAGSDEIIDSTYKHRLFDPSDVNSLLSSLGSYLAYKGIDHLNIIPRSIGDKEIDLTKVYSDGTDVLIPMTIPAYQPATGSGSAAAPGFREVGFYSQDPTGTTDGQGSTSQSVMQRLFNDDWSGYSMRRTLGDVYDGSGASAMVLRLGPQGDADPDAGAGFRYIVTDDDYNFEGWQNMSSDYYVRKGITDDAEKRAEYNRLNMSGRHCYSRRLNQIRVDPVTENMSYSEYDYVGYNDRKDGILIPESDRFEFEEFLMGDEDGEWGGVATDGVLNGRIDFNDDVEGLLEYAEAHFFDVMSNIFPVYEASMKWQDHAFENLYDQSAGVETFDEWRIGAEEDGLISPIPDATDDRIADRDSLEEWEESATAAYYGYLAESGVSTNENVLTEGGGGVTGGMAPIPGDGEPPIPPLALSISATCLTVSIPNI